MAPRLHISWPMHRLQRIPFVGKLRNADTEIARSLTAGRPKVSSYAVGRYLRCSNKCGSLTFGIPELTDGLNFVMLAMGVFGIGEIIANLEQEADRTVTTTKIGRLYPTGEDLRRMFAPALRGTALGSLLGILPGGGALLASFAAYALEKKVSKNSDQFGKGAIEGVAAPEAANNAGAQSSFIPMLTLGIPANPVMALMIGAMIIQGIQPGPSVMTEQPTLFWGLIVSMWAGNVLLLVLNLPLIGLWVRMTTIPYHFLFPAIIAFCAIGAFSLNNQTFDVYLMALFGIVGYILRKLDAQPAPLLLAFCPWADDGGVSAPRAAGFEGRSDDLLRKTDQCNYAWVGRNLAHFVQSCRHSTRRAK